MELMPSNLGRVTAASYREVYIRRDEEIDQHDLHSTTTLVTGGADELR